MVHPRSHCTQIWYVQFFAAISFFNKPMIDKNVMYIQNFFLFCLFWYLYFDKLPAYKNLIKSDFCYYIFPRKKIRYFYWNLLILIKIIHIKNIWYRLGREIVFQFQIIWWKLLEINQKVFNMFSNGHFKWNGF